MIRELLSSRLETLAQHCAQGYGAGAEVTYDYQYPVLVNDADSTDRAIRAAHTVTSVNPNMTPLRGAEDFAYMLKQRPGAFIMVGNGDTAALHTPHYDFNDDLIPVGVQYWAALVCQELKSA